jgi:hypothetical protein
MESNYESIKAIFLVGKLSGSNRIEGGGKPVKMNLEGINGNAFHLLGAFAENARRQGWDERAIEAVREEAMSGDYDHLLRTLISHTDRPEEEGDA